MKRIALLLALIACSCSEAAPDSKHSSSENSRDVIAPAYGKSLARSEVQLMEKRAESGDVAAALALANHYAYAEMNHASAKRWYRLAADGGSIPAMQAMAIYLSESGPGSDCEEAASWIKKAIERASDEKMIRDFQLRESLAELEKTNCVRARKSS